MNDRLTPEQRAEIAARAAAATKGPWSANDPVGVVTTEGGDPLAVFGGCAQDRADAEFTAHAREDVPALLAELQHERYWSKVGWDKAHAYNERWVRDYERFDEERRLVGRLRKELSRQGRAHKDELAAVRAERDQAQARVAELEEAAEQIRFLHKDSPMGPCPVCIDADAMVRGSDGLVPYPCPTARLAGAQDCEPPRMRHAVRTISPAEGAAS